MDRIKKLVKEKLCKKGEAYRRRRMAAGEKSSAYLSGRAVKVCKGQMSGKKKKKKTNEAEEKSNRIDKASLILPRGKKNILTSRRTRLSKRFNSRINRRRGLQIKLLVWT